MSVNMSVKSGKIFKDSQFVHHHKKTLKIEKKMNGSITILKDL